MNTAKWLKIPPRPVKLAGLKFSQEHLDIQGMLKAARGEASYSGDLYPHLVEFEDQVWIVDGHHRIVCAIVRGQETIAARLLIKKQQGHNVVLS